jgi:hypothetical protein
MEFGPDIVDKEHSSQSLFRNIDDPQIMDIDRRINTGKLYFTFIAKEFRNKLKEAGTVDVLFNQNYADTPGSGVPFELVYASTPR